MNKALNPDALVIEDVISLLDTQICEVSHTEGTWVFLVADSVKSHRAGPASLAVSCLVRPGAGDRVAVQFFSNGEKIVTSVVESQKNLVELACDRDMRITTAGTMSINAEQDINMVGKAWLQIETQQVGVKTSNLALKSSVVSATVREVSVIGGTIETVFNRVKSNAVDCFQYAKNLFRQTHETECVQSGSFAQKVAGSHLSEASYVAIVAKKDVRVDGERIHVG